MPTPATQRNYITVARASEILGVSRWTVRQMIRDGRLVGYRSGAKILRLDESEVRASLRPTAGGAGR